MARLLITTEGLAQQIVELRMGVNHVGRDPDCEICIEHDTLSSLHCKLALSDDGVYVQDCNSTNGTFVNDEPVLEAWLDAGQKLRLGDVELLVESTNAAVAIPQFERPRQTPPPPALLPDGLLACPHHAETRATFKCTYCQQIMCNACVKVLRRKGGVPHFLCVLCSHECEPFQAAPPKQKKGFFGNLQDTVKLRIKRTISHFNGED